MPLNIDYTGIPDWEALHTDEHEHTVSQAIGFYSIPLGFGDVTSDNADEVYAAITLYDRLIGVPLVVLRDGSERVPYRITPQDVSRRIGLRTNAVNGQSPRANVVRISREVMSELRGAYQREVLT